MDNDRSYYPKVLISPNGKALPAEVMESLFDSVGARSETVFRRWEFNRLMQYTQGMGIDVGCGLNKIHSCAIGIDARCGDTDFGYPFGANIRCERNKRWVQIPWFKDASLDFVFSSHFLEHLTEPRAMLREMYRVLKPGGYLVLVLPDMRTYPRRGTPGANPDHEWDCYPEDMVDMVLASGTGKIVQVDTLQSQLVGLPLTSRDRVIAQFYGHETLNLSFEVVFQKAFR